MLSLKRRNKNSRRCLVLALGFVCSIIFLSGCSFEEKIDVSASYGTQVSTKETTGLYVFKEDMYQKIADVEANLVFALADEELQDMEVPYFKLADQDLYIDAYQVQPTQQKPVDSDYIPYVAFNENLNTKSKFTLYNEANEPLYHLLDSQSFPIFIKEEDRYGVNIQEHLYYISAEDVQETVSAQNSTVEEAKQVPVLMYHFFYEEADPPESIDGNYVEKEKFREQLQYMKDHDFVTLRMIDVERYLDGEVHLPRHSLAITMDDGAENQAVIAAPLLQEFGFYGTSFLITEWYGEEELPPHWLQAQEMGLETQSHSHGMHTGGCDEQHGSLLLCEDYEKALEDIKLSMEMTKGNVFCYPFGDFDDRVKNIVKDAGIHMAFTTQYGTIEPGMDKLELPRVRVHGEADIDRFGASITY